MNVAFYISVVLCWTSGQAIAASLPNNYESQSKELNGKAVGALPILHIVFDIASGANAQSLSGATRNLLNKLQNAAQNFNSETMMSVSSFTGSDSGDGNYLKVLSQPVNVIQNSQALISIIQSMSGSVTSNINRDPGAAIRDTVNFFSQFIPGAGGILYLLSRRYVDSGPTVKELNMIDTLLSSNMALICVEGTNTNDPNRIFNLHRIARLTEGYYFNNQSTTWTSTNDAASNLLVTLGRSPIDSVRRVIGRTEYIGVSDVALTGSFLVTPDLGNNSVMTIQSSQKGIVTVALTNIQTGESATLMTQGGTNWNMINANLYVDDLIFPFGETRGRWIYGVTFEPAIDALDTKSDVVILGLSSINTNPINYLPGVWTLNCDLELTAQQSTTIYAEVVGPVGMLTGLSITVNLKNIDDTSSQDISIILIEEVEGMGLYSGIFMPPSGGQYNFSADFKADVDSVCIGELCAPSSFTAGALGRCQISASGPSATSSDISSTTTVGTLTVSTDTPSTSTASPSTTAGDTSSTPIMSTTDFMTITSEISTVEDITSTLDADTSTPDGTIIISSTVTDMASTPITTTEPVTTPEISTTVEETTATRTIITDGTITHSSTVITDIASTPITTTGSITTPVTSTLVDTTTTTATRPDSTVQSSTPASNAPSTSVIPTTTRSTTIGTTTAKNVCVWNKNGNFAISPCNSKFIMCSNGNAYILDCPIGLFYNSDSDSCDFPRSAGTGC